MWDDKEEQLEELKRKVEDIERELENLDEGSDDSSAFDELPFSQVTHGDAQFVLHWVLPEDISNDADDPCDIDTVTKAQEIFKDFVKKRQEEDAREILHGDVMVLLCNIAKEEDEETGEVTYPDSCYYVGMCVQTGGAQEENPADPEIKIAETFSSGGESIKEVIVWNTCGAEACPEDPEAIQVQEFRMKSDDEQSSPGSAEELYQGVTATPPPLEYSSLATIDKLRELSLNTKEDDGSEADEDPTQYSIFKEVNSFDVGASFEFSKIFNYNNIIYEGTGTVDRVSIQNKEINGRLEQYSARDVELVTVSISSDSCGSLKVEDALDENEEPIKEDRRVLMTDDVESSMEIKLQDLNVIEGSGEVSLGNVLEQDLLQQTDELTISGNNFKDAFFIPKINDSNFEAVIEGIDIKKELDVIEDFKVDITITSKNETDDEGNEILCSEIRFKPEKKVKKLTFHSGVLTKTEPESPQWESAGAEQTFTAAVCEEGCKQSYQVSGPAGISGEVTCNNSNVTHIAPDCCTTYSGTGLSLINNQLGTASVTGVSGEDAWTAIRTIDHGKEADLRGIYQVDSSSSGNQHGVYDGQTVTVS